MLKNKYYKENLCPQIRVWLAINATVILNMLPYIIYGIIGVVIYMNNFDVTFLDCMMQSKIGKNTVGVDPGGTETFVAASATVTENPSMTEGESSGQHEATSSKENPAKEKVRHRFLAKEIEYLEGIIKKEEELKNEYNLRHADRLGEEMKTTLSNVVNNDTRKSIDIDDLNERIKELIVENESREDPSGKHLDKIKERKRSVEGYVLEAEEARKQVIKEFKKREDHARSSWFNWNWFGIDLNSYGLGFIYKFTLMEKILFAIGIYTAFVIACTILPGLIVNMFSWFTLFIKNSTLLFGEHIKEIVKR